MIPTNGKSLEIDKAVSNSSYISTELKPIDNGKKYTLLAVLKSPQTDTTLHDPITVFIKGKPEPVLETPLYAQVIQDK